MVHNRVLVLLIPSLSSCPSCPRPLPHSVYMEQVERDLMSTLDRLMREESWQPLSADLPVLKSSNELVRRGQRQGEEPGHRTYNPS